MYYSLRTGGMKRCRKDFVYEVALDTGCGECGIIKYGYAMAERELPSLLTLAGNG